MRQYCRYCSNLCIGDAIWCCEKQTELSEAYTKIVNHCKSFSFNGIDAYDINSVYKPRKAKKTVAYKLSATQMTLEQEGE